MRVKQIYPLFRFDDERLFIRLMPALWGSSASIVRERKYSNWNTPAMFPYNYNDAHYNLIISLSRLLSRRFRSHINPHSQDRSMYGAPFLIRRLCVTASAQRPTSAPMINSM